MESKYLTFPLLLSNLEFMTKKINQGKSFSMHVLENIELQKGKLYTYLPEKITYKNITEFMRGDIADLKITKEYLLSYIEKYLKEKNENIVLFENSCAQITDKWVQGAKSRILGYKKEVYHVLFHDCNKDDIKIAWEEATNAWQNILYCTFDKSKKMSVEKTLKNEDLIELSKNVYSIVIDAYDLDGFIFWERGQ